ncbi:MAG TPA: hypothetical protein VHU15_10765 [Stellaceae bacterium]|jgi:hypothetical protein|nr:hypothetical protein [Stellaceae bacterium]
MAYYNLKRAADQKLFTAYRTDDEAALFYFSVLTGDELTFDGDGPPPYLFGRQRFSTKPIATQIPVYRKAEA